ncbi:ImuA family protein [Brevundimonas staleyi]|uniref:ImuA family protein n=1 Tax=Brevundimonas staleyi TaxID=74326 RepID=A0ABW0FRK3_9CAUL
MSLPSSSAPDPAPPPLSTLSEGLEEVCAGGARDVASALAFTLGRADVGAGRGVVLSATRAWLGENGRPYGPGLAGFRAREGFLLVETKTEGQALWVMEQALRSGGAALVIGTVDGAELAQTRRLEFAARDGACSGVLLRSRSGDLSAARRRWRITTLASNGGRFDRRAPGRMTIRAEMTRSRMERPGVWMLEQDDETDRLRLADRLAGDGLGAVGRTQYA